MLTFLCFQTKKSKRQPPIIVFVRMNELLALLAQSSHSTLRLLPTCLVFLLCSIFFLFHDRAVVLVKLFWWWISVEHLL